MVCFAGQYAANRNNLARSCVIASLFPNTRFSAASSLAWEACRKTSPQPSVFPLEGAAGSMEITGRSGEELESRCM